MKKIICSNYIELSRTAADIIAEEMIKNPRAVLGLATGSTPIGTYEQLIAKHREDGLDFSGITTFNLDEYYGLDARHPQSYNYFMHEKFFRHININYENVHFPNGTPSNIEEECKRYDALLEACGGIDLQLLGIGMNGHIGFNEPGNTLQINTHLVNLTKGTIKANSRFFASEEEVPDRAITMGIGGILKAKRILLLVSGKGKAEIVSDMLDGRLNTHKPASVLQIHKDVTTIIDIGIVPA